MTTVSSRCGSARNVDRLISFHVDRIQSSVGPRGEPGRPGECRCEGAAARHISAGHFAEGWLAKRPSRELLTVSVDAGIAAVLVAPLIATVGGGGRIVPAEASRAN